MPAFSLELSWQLLALFVATVTIVSYSWYNYDESTRTPCSILHCTSCNCLFAINCLFPLSFFKIYLFFKTKYRTSTSTYAVDKSTQGLDEVDSSLSSHLQVG